jgi:hypothetical protein
MNQIVSNVLRGADPELFLRAIDTNFPVTSIGRIGGSKREPRQLGGGFALQEDNVTVEFNIPPADSKAKFIASIEYVLGYLRSELEPKGLKLDISATMDFDIQDLMHPQAQELGCEPDSNAWTGRNNPRPHAPETLRSSGGHLHIGYENPSKEVSTEIIKAHDLFCGVSSLVHDSDTRRRQIYGKAGACRYKGYGVEYRTLSNFWIKSPELISFMYEQSEKAINFVNNGETISREWANKIVRCINQGDMDLFAEIDAQFHIL